MMDTWVISQRTENATALPPHATDHPLFQQVEGLIQQGNWQAARPLLEELLELYPRDSYVKEMAASARTRSALLDSAPDMLARPARPAGVAQLLKYIMPVVAVLALLGFIAVAILALRLWILPQATAQRQMTRLTQIRQDARAALSSGDYDRAMLGYEEVLNLVPGDVEAQDGLDKAGELRSSAALYSEAVAQMEAHRWETALGMLQQLQAEQPGNRDVEERMAFVQEQQALSDRFAQAENLFKGGDYEQAIQAYEALQALDYGFQRDSVQSHLFLSYLQLALARENEAAGDPQELQGVLELLEKALLLRPDDSQAKGESQLLRLYLAGLERLEAGDWADAMANLTPVYESRPDFAEGSLAQRLYEAQVAYADELLAAGQVDEALAGYREARLTRGVEAEGLDQKIAAAEEMLLTPTPSPEPAQPAPEPGGAAAAAAGGGGAAAPAPPPTPTPVPLPYSLKGMNVKSNCDGVGYIHGVVWSAYNLPMAGVVIQAINTTTGYGPLVSLPTNQDGIYQIIIEADHIDGLWAVQVLENGAVASQAWGQHLGGGCVNGAQELKVDWQRARETP
jgi:tetratricopeptide (TPR) repeat protein